MPFKCLKTRFLARCLGWLTPFLVGAGQHLRCMCLTAANTWQEQGVNMGVRTRHEGGAALVRQEGGVCVARIEHALERQGVVFAGRC
jgi:hypothetical protein